MTGPTPRVDGGTPFVRPYVLARLAEDQPRANASRTDPEFTRQLDSGLVDIYGRPLHPEGRDFFAEHHQGHEH